MAEIPSPLPPKSVFKGEEPSEERSPLVVLALQFFVIPLLIVLFCVCLYFIFRWLTYERRDINDYLSALNAKSPSSRQEAAFALLNYIQEAKRWQSLSDLNDQLRFDREKFLRENPEFVPKLIETFKSARGSDPKVAQYVSQVLSLVGGPEASEVLLETLKEGGPAEQEIFVMIALGKLREARAVPLILERIDSSDAGVKYAALFALGFFDDERAVRALKQALNNPDSLATWNAAFSLARQSGGAVKHREAVPVLKRLLDGEFVRKVAAGMAGAPEDQRPVLDPAQIELYRIRAVQLLGIFLGDDASLKADLQKVAENDPQLGVRQAAIDVLRGQTDTRGMTARDMDFTAKQ
jgi:HEAT repeat protein